MYYTIGVSWSRYHPPPTWHAFLACWWQISTYYSFLSLSLSVLLICELSPPVIKPMYILLHVHTNVTRIFGILPSLFNYPESWLTYRSHISHSYVYNQLFIFPLYSPKKSIQKVTNLILSSLCNVSYDNIFFTLALLPPSNLCTHAHTPWHLIMYLYVNIVGECIKGRRDNMHQLWQKIAGNTLVK